MILLLQLLSVNLALLICQVQSLHGNLSCEYGTNCANDKCPPGYFRSGANTDASEQCLKCPVNFYNHMAGKESCLPCGSEAIQPEEGQTTCICLGEGRIFQPSDSRCPCSPGYHPADNGINCVRIVYDICRDGSSRNHEGKCLTKQEWDDYCSNQVCVSPQHYQGYDKFLGLCICHTEDLDSICNTECRRKQKHSLQIICKENTPQLISTDSSGNKVLIGAEDIRTEALISSDGAEDICSSKPSNLPSVYLVKTTEQGFWGLYYSNPKDINKHLESTYNFTLHNISGGHIAYRSDKTSGILNPTTCIHVNDFIMFIASQHSYPIYDVNNLYNTNPDFDWGPFRTLAEEMRLSLKPRSSFLFQFQEPGVYVIKLSSNHYKKMYIRVMIAGGQCYEEGPFFPTAPRHVIRNGIAQAPPPLLKPDWPAIAGVIIGLMLILITCIVLLVWFQDFGWAAKTFTIPHFRKLQLKYNLDSYSSKGSSLTTSKKLHPRTKIKCHVDKKWEEASKQKCQKFLEDDEFWDYEQQVDIESFDSHTFYDILLKQSHLVTSKLGLLKDEVKGFYEKLVYEVSTLKETFMKQLSITGHPNKYSNSILESYIQKKQEADLEIAKRKRLAAEYEDILKKQLRVLQEDMKSQEEHCVMFNAVLRESVRLLAMMKDKTGSSAPRDSQFTIKLQRYLAQFDTSCNTMYTAVMKESNRLKLWGVLGEGTGAYLVNKERTRLLSKRDLVEGSFHQSDIVCTDPVLGLITPKPHSVMLLSSHYLTPVPDDYFIHSDTGKVLAIAGNVGYDPATCQLISTVDSAYRDIWKTNVPVLPYITYPLNPSTGLPLDCKLPEIHQAQYQNFSIMVDPVSGLEVPILAVTRHPKTRQWLAVGGTYLHPFTNTLSPIEIGGPMVGETGKVFPILGVGLNTTTSDIIPLGGMVSASGAVSVLGDIFCEPLSGKKARIQGAILQQDKVMPFAGGYHALLDSNLMMAQIAVIDALKAHRDLFSEDLPFVKEDFLQVHAAFTDVLETMKKALSIRNQYMMSRVYNVTSQQKLAEDIKQYGGNLGMIKYHKTELWIPAVLGLEIPDPGPSDLMVPVLGVEHDYNKGHLIPLAGTMEDPDGRGLIPIKIGARTINPITGSRCTVVGVQTSPMTGIITPVMQLAGPLKDRDSYLLEALQNELVMREKFWQGQLTKEEELLKELNSLAFYVLDAARERKTHKIRLKEKIASMDESCQSFEDDSLREVQRRACSNLNSLILKISNLPIIEGITEEKEQELIFSLVIKKTSEKLMEFTKKIEQESERQISQLREWMKSKEQGGEAVIKARQTAMMVNYIDEFEDHIMKRLSGVDAAYCRVEYVREQNKMQGLLTKSYLLGTSPYYINPQRSYWEVAKKDHRHIGQLLIPMLKHLTEIVEGSKKSTPLSEGQPPGSGYSSRSTLKASAANSEKIQVSSSAAKRPQQTTNFHMFNSIKIIQRHHGYLIRFLTEKQASELVHLESILLSEEMNRIWNFYEFYKVKTNSSTLAPQDLDKQYLKSNSEINSNVEWGKMVEELTEVHGSALTALYKKHQEEVKTMGLNPNTVIPEHYFNRDMKAAILQLAMDILKTYQQLLSENCQGMSSTENKIFTEHKDSQNVLLLKTIAAKFVRQELLIQIHMYDILDTYTGIQMSNCAEEVQKILTKLQYKPYFGKAAAEEAADIMEKQYIERLICFLKKSYNEKQNQLPLAEMKSQLREEHCSLTEKCLQEKDTLSLQEMAKCSDSKCNIDIAICFMSCQRHLRQTVILLQECFKTPKQNQEKLFKNMNDNTNTMHCQEDLSQLINNKTEVRYLFTDLQNVLKRIQLREHHLKELSGKLKEYCSDKVHILSCLEEMNCLQYELQDFVDQQLKCLKEELKALSECSQFNDQCKTMASEQKRDIPLNEQELFKQSKHAEVEQIHRKQILDEHLKLQDQLERGELNDLLKEKLVKEHDETIAFLEKALQQNLEMVDRKLEKEIRRRQKPEGFGHLDAHMPLEKPSLQNSDQKILCLLVDNISIFQQAEQIAAARTALLVPHMYISKFPEDENASKLQESSLLLTLLKEVNSQLKANAQNSRLIGVNGSDKRNGFRDIQDLQVNCEGDLNPVRPEDLSGREFIIYQYGIHILQLLKSHTNIEDLYLHIASSMPVNNYQGNAFAHSFFYLRSENKLFVSRDYLQSVGSFTLLLTHCISHILSGGFEDDSNPFFLRTFYQAIKVCFTEGFFTRYELSFFPQPKNESRVTKEEGNLKENLNFISQLISMKFTPTDGNNSYKERTEHMLSMHEVEAIIKKKLAKKKREFFNDNFKKTTCVTMKQEESQDGITMEQLYGTLDQLNTQLIAVLEKEVEAQNNPAGQNYYLNALILEKECLIKKIENVEQQITLLSSIM